jgi:hypothetical protein
MEETMKCLKDTKTGTIIRVSDLEAFQKASNRFQYASKSEYKAQFKKVETPKTDSNEQDRSK